MSSTNGNQINGFAVEVKRYGRAHPISDDRVACRISSGTDHLSAQFFTREDDNAHLSEEWITSGMVGMDVRVRHETNGIGADFFNRSEQLFRDLSILGVDHE